MNKIFLTITLLISTLALNATITVTNVDTLLSSFTAMTYVLDLDNDGNGDYSIETYYGGNNNTFYTRIDIKMLSANSEIVSVPVWPSTTFFSIDPMDSGEVFPNYFFSRTTHIYDHVNYTDLHSTNNKYVALRLLKGGNYHYGWVSIDVGFDGYYVEVKDYVYEDIPNRIITAGQTVSSVTTGITALKNEASFSVYPNPVQNTLTIKPVNEASPSKVNIYNINGVLVENTKQQGLKLDVSALASGVYFVELITDNNKTIKKIIKN